LSKWRINSFQSDIIVPKYEGFACELLPIESYIYIILKITIRIVKATLKSRNFAKNLAILVNSFGASVIYKL